MSQGCHLVYLTKQALATRGKLNITMGHARVLWVSSNEVVSEADARKRGRTTLFHVRRDKHDRNKLLLDFVHTMVVTVNVYTWYV